MSLPDKLFVWDMAARASRPKREHAIPYKDRDGDFIVACGYREPGTVPIAYAKHFNSAGFRLTYDEEGVKPYEFATKSNERDASGGVRLKPGQTVAHLSELKADALSDRCQLEGIDTSGMKAKDMLAALLSADGASGSDRQSADDEDDFNPADVELDDEDGSQGDDDNIDVDQLINNAMKD